ncbi:hypothetical protein ACOMHN_064609 [Nucella lapillus]
MSLALLPGYPSSSTGDDDKNLHHLNFLDSYPALPDTPGIPQGSEKMSSKKSTECESSADCLEGSAFCTTLTPQDGKKHCVCYDTGQKCPNVRSNCNGDCGPQAYCTIDKGCVCKATGLPRVKGVCPLSDTGCHSDADCVKEATCTSTAGGRNTVCVSTFRTSASTDTDFCLN